MWSEEPTLLIVDDRPANLLALEAILDPLGVPLVKATSGAGALRYLLRLGDRVALVLLDVQMPDLDGFETAAMIRARPLLQHVPIIFITATSREEAHIVKAYAHGAIDYLMKPFDPEALRVKAKQLVEIHRHRLQLEREKREADQLRWRSEERLVLALDAAHLGMWSWDADTGSVYCDERCRQLLDSPSLGSIDAVKVTDVKHRSDGRFQFEYCTPLGRWIDVTGRIYGDRSPHNSRIAGTMKDITVEKREREERELFLGALGHDLRNPLNAISIAGELISRAGDPATAEHANRIRAGAHRMSSLIGDLLDFVRSRSGGVPIQRQSIDLASLGREVIAELEAGHPGVKIELQSTGATDGHWDPARLVQVMQNLLSNAIRHAAPGTRPRVVLRDEGEVVAVAIENDGTPIAPELRSRIFEPLVTGAGGLGLGLYIVKQLVTAHQGTIELTSTGAQTIFTVTLPRNRQKISAADCG